MSENLEDPAAQPEDGAGSQEQLDVAQEPDPGPVDSTPPDPGTSMSQEPEPGTAQSQEPVPDPAPAPPEPVQVDLNAPPVTGSTMAVLQSASNESPILPPNAQASAARAHVALGHLITIAQGLRSDIERYVPATVLSAAEAEVAAMIRGVL